MFKVKTLDGKPIKGKEKKMKKTFAFITKDSFRCEVKASSPKAGYNKLMDIPHLAEKITKAYTSYNASGLSSLDNWKSI